MQINKIKKIAFCACSDNYNENNILILKNIFKEYGIEVLDFKETNSYEAKASILNNYFNLDLDLIIDVSGGDSAEKVVAYLDFELIAKSKSIYMGYSDNTVIISALSKFSNKKSILFNINNILKNKDICNMFFNDFEKLFYPDKFNIVGGNIRCLIKFLKKYNYDFKNKKIILESYKASLVDLNLYLEYLKNNTNISFSNKIIVGNFYKIKDRAAIIQVFKNYFKNLEIESYNYVGHINDSKAVLIGNFIDKNEVLP